MPVNVTGVKQLQKAMRDVDKDLNKEMSKNIRQAMLIVRNKARGYLPAQSEVLSGWGKGTASAETIKDKYRAFPPYDYALARDKVQYSAGQNKVNKSGFRAAFYVYNNSAPGAIFETAGRINKPRGNRSLNPNAPIQFNAAAEEFLGAVPAEEVLLIRRLLVAVAGREHHAFHAELHHLVEKEADAGGVGPLEKGGVGGDAEAALDGLADGLDGDLVGAIAADGSIVLGFEPSMWTLKVRNLVGLKRSSFRLRRRALVQR